MSKNILITGISRGLGLFVTQFLLAEGHCVYGITRSESEALRELKKSYPERLNILYYDLSKVSKLKVTVKDFIPSNIPIHAFINNAAIAYADLITNMKIDKLEHSFQVNVFAPFTLCDYVIRNMILHKTKGSLIHISSVSAHTGYKGLSMYAATKGALEAFSKGTAREWGSKGIRSNCVVAGFMETEMSAILESEVKQKIFNRTALKQAVNMESVAKTISFLLDEPCSITGQNVFVDSGTI